MTETIATHDMYSKELYRTNEGLGISVSKYVAPEEYDMLWNMVESGFKELNQKSYEKQDMTREELESDLRSEQVLKYIALDADKGLVGLLTVHMGLDGISWTDVSELKRAQNETDPDATPYYVGTIVVPPTERGTTAATSLIRGALLHFKEVNNALNRDSLVFFDCAEANYPWLGRLIQGIGSPSEEFPDLSTQVRELYTDAWVENEGHVSKVHKHVGGSSEKILDKQHYYAISIDRE